MADRKALKRQAQFAKLADTNTYNGITVRLFPNGEEREIWISDGYHSISVVPSKGSAGLSLTVSRHAGTAPLTINGNKDAKSNWECIPQIDAEQITLTQYNWDDRSQAHKQWYGLHVHPESDTEDAVYKQGKMTAAAEILTDRKFDFDDYSKPDDEHLRNIWLSGYYSVKAGHEDKWLDSLREKGH